MLGEVGQEWLPGLLLSLTRRETLSLCVRAGDPPLVRKVSEDLVAKPPPQAPPAVNTPIALTMSFTLTHTKSSVITSGDTTPHSGAPFDASENKYRLHHQAISPKL